MTEAEELRERCLVYALEFYRQNGTGAGVRATAQKFFDFIVNQESR